MDQKWFLASCDQHRRDSSVHINSPRSERLVRKADRGNKRFAQEDPQGGKKKTADGIFIERLMENTFEISVFANDQHFMPKWYLSEMCLGQPLSQELLQWYHSHDTSLSVLAEFHARYECIHPFQDGNGRTRRVILFRECLVNDLVPLIIMDENRTEYLHALAGYRNG